MEGALAGDDKGSNATEEYPKDALPVPTGIHDDKAVVVTNRKFSAGVDFSAAPKSSKQIIRISASSRSDDTGSDAEDEGSSSTEHSKSKAAARLSDFNINQWDEWFSHLLTFGRDYGHYNVPRSYDIPYRYASTGGRKLGRWLQNQRHQKKLGTLREERRLKLQALVDAGLLEWYDEVDGRKVAAAAGATARRSFSTHSGSGATTLSPKSSFSSMMNGEFDEIDSSGDGSRCYFRIPPRHSFGAGAGAGRGVEFAPPPVAFFNDRGNVEAFLDRHAAPSLMMPPPPMFPSHPYGVAMMMMGGAAGGGGGGGGIGGGVPPPPFFFPAGAGGASSMNPNKMPGAPMGPRRSLGSIEPSSSSSGSGGNVLQDPRARSIIVDMLTRSSTAANSVVPSVHNSDDDNDDITRNGNGNNKNGNSSSSSSNLYGDSKIFAQPRGGAFVSRDSVTSSTVSSSHQVGRPASVYTALTSVASSNSILSLGSLTDNAANNRYGGGGGGGGLRRNHDSIVSDISIDSSSSITSSLGMGDLSARSTSTAAGSASAAQQEDYDDEEEEPAQRNVMPRYDFGVMGLDGKFVAFRRHSSAGEERMASSTSAVPSPGAAMGGGAFGGAYPYYPFPPPGGGGEQGYYHQYFPSTAANKPTLSPHGASAMHMMLNAAATAASSTTRGQPMVVTSEWGRSTPSQDPLGGGIAMGGVNGDRSPRLPTEPPLSNFGEVVVPLPLLPLTDPGYNGEGGVGVGAGGAFAEYAAAGGGGGGGEGLWSHGVPSSASSSGVSVHRRRSVGSGVGHQEPPPPPLATTASIAAAAVSGGAAADPATAGGAGSQHHNPLPSTKYHHIQQVAAPVSSSTAATAVGGGATVTFNPSPLSLSASFAMGTGGDGRGSSSSSSSAAASTLPPSTMMDGWSSMLLGGGGNPVWGNSSYHSTTNNVLGGGRLSFGAPPLHHQRGGAVLGTPSIQGIARPLNGIGSNASSNIAAAATAAATAVPIPPSNNPYYQYPPSSSSSSSSSFAASNLPTWTNGDSEGMSPL